MREGTLILITGALLALSIAANLAAGRLRVPGLVLFLGLGIVLGGGGFGLFRFDDVELARAIGVIALSLILFEGGLAAGWREIGPVIGEGVSLALVGTMLTAAITGVAAVWLLDLSLVEGLLVGSTLAASDAAAVLSVLRGSSLKRRLARTLEAESGLNDPVAVVLVLGCIAALQSPGYGLADGAWFFAVQLLLGLAVGVAVGKVAVMAFERLRFASAGLYPVASIAAAALSFGAADTLGGSGFLAVYLTGLALGGRRVAGRQTVEAFHGGVAFLSQIALFVTLGLLVVPSRFDDVLIEGVAIAFVLMFFARPIAALVATRVGRYSLNEALLIGWAGLRGAIPIVLAVFAVIEGVPRTPAFFELILLVVVISTLLQGTTIEPLARALGVTTSEPALPPPLMEVGRIRELGAEVVEFPVGPTDAAAGRVINELGLPREALVNVIVRAGEALLPRGSTQIEPGDRLHILVREAMRAEVEGLFDRWRHGPLGEAEGREPRRPTTGRAAIFTVRPWRAEDGDPGAPAAVDGVSVQRVIRVRRGEAAALVQLVDGRHAVTGDGTAAVGGPRQLSRYCRARIRRASDPETRAWWQEVSGVMSQRALG